MYKFYKILDNGKRKYVETFDSTLDPNYHAYINWCRQYQINWELIRVSDGEIIFKG